MNIPVIDFSPCNLGENSVLDEHIVDLGRQLKSSFTEIGFVYLKNTGITQEEVEQVMDISKTFFLQPVEMKVPFRRGSFANFPNHGWVSSEAESLNPRRPGDLKEAFNSMSFHNDIHWPSPVFEDRQLSFYQRCRQLSLRVLRVMAISLGLEPEVFLHAHRHIGGEKNGTTLRSLYYPPVNSELVKEGQLRCGEHSDYGSITLVFQGQAGGLQVLSTSGEYIPAPCIPGTVLINIADLMQRWTSDHFISAIHRVLLPPAGDSSTRQSLAFFVQPDDDYLITCCDGSNKYPAVKSGDYLNDRLAAAHGDS
ncbi:uncharacterized protein LOC130389719 [Gadus chalcogrammus]|uniref:uncharacterized protein LOC130389719 n=1 Tax=Gadus chalcogrammus TaxID=1042646 RepID=UPI0024C4BBAD|nr:uncharacterized protein LOC130389719 [Gadus chalcogrammus]